MHKLLARQLRRTLGIADERALESVLCTLERVATMLPPDAQPVALGLRELLARVGEAYAQGDRDLDLRARSLDISSAELTQVNEVLEAEVAAQRRAVRTLRETIDMLAIEQ